MKFVSNLNLNQNEIRNGTFEIVATDPATNNFEGRLIYNSTEKLFKVYTGTAWRKQIHAATSSTTALTISESNGALSLSIADATNSASGLLSATNHAALVDATPVNVASTIVKRDATGGFSAETITAAAVTGLNAPVNAADAANKAYVDAARSGLDVKDSVRASTTAPITLSGEQTVDGVELVAGNRVLVKNQTTASTNGIYVVAEGAWQRSTDANTDAKVTSGLFTFVEEGTVNGDSGWVLITDNPITLGDTGLVFAQFSGTGQIDAGDGLSKTGNTLNVNVDTTSIEIVSDTLRVAAGAAGAGLGYATGVLSVTVAASGGLEIDTDAVQLKLASNSALTLSASGLAVASTIAGTGLTFTSGVLSVNAVNLASTGSGGITGTLPVANGGTGTTTLTSDGVLLGNGTSAVTVTAAGTANQLLRVPSGGGSPAFGSIDLSTSAAVGVSLLGIANGGTGAATAAGARTALAVPTRYVAAVPAGATTATVTHSLNTTDVIVEVYEASSGDTVLCDVSRTSANAISLGFSTAPTTNQYRVVVLAVE
jgi:hypothetical protein